jgi:RNA ligase (TIGR02306 family)
MKLASIEIIKNLRDHPNADTLQIGEVLAWQVVVKKGIHQEGNKIVFITIDTIVPRYHWSDFLVDPKNPDKQIRIKNVKLRGEYSSGVVIPLSQFTESFSNMEVGTDITEILGIQKYIKEIPANLSGETLGDFPTHLTSKTDEDNGLNDPDLVEKVLNHDTYITVTSKLDGSSCTLIVENVSLSQVCTRNFSKKETEHTESTSR